MLNTLKNKTLPDFKELIRNHIPAAISISSIFFHLCLFLTAINDEYRILSSDLTQSRVREYLFPDDRSLWLNAVEYFGKNLDYGPHEWQLSLWPPGHILTSSAIYLIVGNLNIVLVLDYMITSLLTTLILLQIYYWFNYAKVNFVFYFLISVSFLFSPIYLSAMIETFFLTDLQSTLAGTLAILRIIRMVNSKEKTRKLDIAIASLLLAFAGYVRLTFYQITLLALALSIAFLLFSYLPRNKDSYLNLRKSSGTIFKVTALTFFIFLPWIVIRGFVIYSDSFERGMEFSLQTRFALQSQWYDEVRLETEPNYPLVGQGIACKIDAVKCEFFTKQNKEILLGIKQIPMDEDFDLKSKEALKVFIKNPIEWVKLKWPVYGTSFFQKSVYDGADGNFHFSWDRVLVLFCFVINPILWLYARWKRIKLIEGSFALIVLSIFQIAQFLLTQLYFRFYLPAIAFTLSASCLILIGLQLERRGNTPTP